MYVMQGYKSPRPPITVTQRGQTYLGIAPVAIPLAKAGISIVASIFGGAHAKAVQQEQQTLGIAMGAIQQSFDQIEAGVSQGKMSREQAISELDRAFTEFDRMVAPIRKMTGTAGQTGDPKAGGQCNAACVYTHKYRAEVAARKQRYATQVGGIGGDLMKYLPYAALAAVAYGVLA